MRVSGSCEDEIAAILTSCPHKIIHLGRRVRAKSRVHSILSRTPLFLILSWRYLKLLGLRSFARTAQPFFAAGMAKGPTPANTSAITSSGLNSRTKRSCSVCSREFQYTCVKSNVNEQLDSCWGRYAPLDGFQDLEGWPHTCSTRKLGSPAMSSIWKNRNVASMVFSLLTTVLISLFF